MTERRAPRPRRAFRGEVRRTERLTPRMVRVVLGGDGLRRVRGRRVHRPLRKLLFPPAGRATRSRSTSRRSGPSAPRAVAGTRTYTVRAWDPEAASSPSTSSSTATRASPGRGRRGRAGDELWFGGPGGAYAPDPSRRTGTCSPATRARCPRSRPPLERLPAGAVAHAFVEVAGPEEEPSTHPPADGHLGAPGRPATVGDRLVAAVRALEWPARRAARVRARRGRVRQGAAPAPARRARRAAGPPVDLRLLAARRRRGRLAVGQARVEPARVGGGGRGPGLVTRPARPDARGQDAPAGRAAAGPASMARGPSGVRPGPAWSAYRPGTAAAAARAASATRPWRRRSRTARRSQAAGPSGVQPKNWLTPGVCTTATSTPSDAAVDASTAGLVPPASEGLPELGADQRDQGDRAGPLPAAGVAGPTSSRRSRPAWWRRPAAPISRVSARAERGVRALPRAAPSARSDGGRPDRDGQRRRQVGEQVDQQQLPAGQRGPAGRGGGEHAERDLAEVAADQDAQRVRAPTTTSPAPRPGWR